MRNPKKGGAKRALKKPVPGKSLADIGSPELLAAWRGFEDPYYSAYGPADVLSGSAAVGLWFCPEHPAYPYPREIRKQVKRQVCSYCSPQGRLHPEVNSLKAQAPALAAQWHPTLNGDLTPADVRPFSNTRVWWTCTCPDGDDHVWFVSPANRMPNPEGCPFRTGHRVALSTSIATRRPDLAPEWVADRNLPFTTATVSPGSSSKDRRFYWRCQADPSHQYPATVHERALGGGCSLCRGLRVDHTNSLATKRPDVAAQWHTTLNGDLTPDKVTVRSGIYVWWQCPEGSADEPHEWRTIIANRTGAAGAGTGSGCRVCAGQAPTRSTSLGAVNPVLAAQWHPTLNGDLTPWDVLPKSDRIVNWQCPVNPSHVWPATVGNRSMGRGCPECRLVRTSEKEIRLCHELATVLPWDPAIGIVTLASGKYWYVDFCLTDERLIVEYDGAWWHTGKETRDRVKSDSLASEGWKVVRVRVDPLPLESGASREDVSAAPDEPAHVTARRVLEVCVERGWLAPDALDSYGEPEADCAHEAANAAIAEQRRLIAAAEDLDKALDEDSE